MEIRTCDYCGEVVQKRHHLTVKIFARKGFDTWLDFCGYAHLALWAAQRDELAPERRVRGLR